MPCLIPRFVSTRLLLVVLSGAKGGGRKDLDVDRHHPQPLLAQARRDAHAVHCHLKLSRWCTLYIHDDAHELRIHAQAGGAEQSREIATLWQAKSNFDAIAA